MASDLRTKNITYDDRDTENLKYGSNWYQDWTWNASNVGQTGTLSGSNDPNANVTFNFPVPAIAFHYFGIRRAKGAFYGICIDCDLDPKKTPNFQNIDAYNVTDDGKNPPVLLFSKRFDTPAQHVVILRNQNDTRGVPRGNSELTIDRFVLEVVDDSPVPVTSHIGAIVGGAIGGFLLAIIMIATGVYYWHRRHKRNLASALDDFDPDDSETNFPTMVPYPVMNPSSVLKEQPKAGESNPTPQRPTSPTPSSASTAIVTYFRFRRRGWHREVDTERRPERRHETDAGPIPAEDEESTLPPLYDQVFQADLSNCPPSGQEPNGQSQPISFNERKAAR